MLSKFNVVAGYRIRVTVVHIHAGALGPLINSCDDVHLEQTMRVSNAGFLLENMESFPAVGQQSPGQISSELVKNTCACVKELAGENGLRHQNFNHALG